ncbi:MAG: TadE/TadG family type IV pilus assembly protein [Acidimicrobiia bacterium]
MNRPGRQRGAVSTELAVLTPLLIAFMLLVVYAGRVAQTEGDVAHAAHEAARAASLVATPTAAIATATETVAANIAAGTVACRNLTVSVDTSGFTAGGQVAVTVTCEAAFADIAMLAVPGTRLFAATGVEVIDIYRANTRTSP